MKAVLDSVPPAIVIGQESKRGQGATDSSGAVQGVSRLRTLIEVGRIVAAIMQEARRLGRSPAVRYEFDDREVDRLMEVDGVEESVVAAVELD